MMILIMIIIMLIMIITILIILHLPGPDLSRRDGVLLHQYEYSIM